MADWVATPMVGVLLFGIIGTFLTSYTRARAEALGIDAKVGLLQRPERVVLLSAPQAFFGLLLNGWVLITIVLLLVVTAWITAIQRIMFVYHATKEADAAESVRASSPAQASEARAHAELARARGDVGASAEYGPAAPR